MKTILLTTVIVLLLAATAPAYWPSDPQTNAPVCLAADDQTFPEIIAGDSGSVIIVWQDNRNGLYTDIYAQKLDAEGDTLLGPDGISICTMSGWQTEQQVVADDSGGVIIVWRDGRVPNSDIYAQKIGVFGFTLWQANGMPISTATGFQTTPQIISDGSGGAIIVWEDTRNGSGDVYAQRISIYGDTLWTYDGMPISTASGSQSEPVIATDGSGGAIVAWSDWRGSDGDIYAQRVDANGDTLWGYDGLLICGATNSQYSQKIVSDGSGGAIIAWKDQRTDSEGDIYAQRINASGDTLWAADGLPICTAANEQAYLHAIMDGSGGVIIAWRDYRTDTEGDIYAQRIDASGTVQWTTNGVPICTVSGYQLIPQMMSDGASGAIIAWADRRDGSQYDIYAQRIDSNGSTSWAADGMVICSAEADQTNPDITFGEASRAVVCWEDDRNADTDIYAQLINLNGSLGPAPGIVSVHDYPNDQGKQVGLLWDRSYLDDGQYGDITEYSIWRKFPPSSKGMPASREWNGDQPSKSMGQIYRRTEHANKTGIIKTNYWEYLGSVDAHYLEGYAFTAATFEDSSASGTPYCSFFVSAHTDSPGIFFDSAPDSGYSVDDIGPAPTVLSLALPAKSALTIADGSGKTSKGSLNLSWDQVTTGTDGSPETGPITYHLHGDTTAHFTPGPSTLITSTAGLSHQHTDTRIGDPATDLFYQVIVTDGSGNASAGSNRTGEIDWNLSATTGTDYAWISLALDDSSLTMASDLEAAIEAHSSPTTNCLTVSQWNPTAQTYTHYTTVPVPMGDFALTAGLSCRVETDTAGVVTLVGAVPTAGSLSFDLLTTTGTDYTWISLPLELDSLTMASDLEAHIEAHSDSTTNCLTVSRWNPTAQTYTHYTTVPVPMGDFAIRPGRPYRVEVSAEAQWPYSGKGLREFQRVLRTR